VLLATDAWFTALNLMDGFKGKSGGREAVLAKSDLDTEKGQNRDD